MIPPRKYIHQYRHQHIQKRPTSNILMYSMVVVVAILASAAAILLYKNKTSMRNVRQETPEQTIETFLQANKKGEDTKSFWQNREDEIKELAGSELLKEMEKTYRVQLFTPTSWEIVSKEKPYKTHTGHNAIRINVIIESSNKGGSPIRKTWQFILVQISGEWKIRAISDTSK